MSPLDTARCYRCRVPDAARRYGFGREFTTPRSGVRMTTVQPEPTPNPDALKFTLDRQSTERRNETFRDGSDPADSPLGAKIFALGGVTNVFLVSNFVSVTKAPDADWDDLVPRIVETIGDHFDG